MTDDDSRDRERAAGPLPRQATMGLLDYLAATAMDEDYAYLARRRDRGEAEDRGRSTAARVVTVVVLTGFALLLTVAGVQTARNEPTRQAGRESLVGQVEERRERLETARAEVVSLRSEITQLRARQLSGTAQGRALQARLDTLGAAVGARPVSGPGMVVTVDDAPDASTDRERVLDGDLQRLVNGLWEAGAEAIAINGQRLSALSAVRTAGEAITVNFKPLRPPYEVAVIGNPNQIPARFVETRGGAWWLNLRSVYNVRFDMNSKEELILPAVRLDRLRVARVPETAP